MGETVYNLFAYADGGLITHLGIEKYNLIDDGPDSLKYEFLQERAFIDHATAHKVRVITELQVTRYKALERLGQHLELFEPLLEMYNVPECFLFTHTMIMNGEPKIDNVYYGQLDLSRNDETEHFVDYLHHYMTDDGFDIPRLLNDDYFKAIKILFNERLLVSSTKLLMIFLDTAAYIDTGDPRGNFQPWLSSYVNLQPLGITPEELWELRNGLLHMSNTTSKKVRENKVASLIPCVNYDGETASFLQANQKPFDLYRLMMAISEGINKWVQTYNETPSKLAEFVERYDLVISDTRVSLTPKHSR